MKRALLLILSAVALGWGIWEGFGKWEKRRLLQVATDHYQNGDFRSAVLSARELLRREPHNIPAHRLMGQVCKDANSTEALDWLGKLVQLQPGSSPALLDLALTASGLGELYLGQITLQKVLPPDRHSLQFHQAATALAIASKQHGLAREHLQEALKLEPQNPLLLLNLATLQLLATDPKVVASACGRLELMQNDPELGPVAIHTLLQDARMRRDRSRSIALANRGIQIPGGNLKDRLNCLEVIQESAPNAFGGQLSQILSECASDPRAASRLITWMNARGLSQAALGWAAGLSPAVVESPPVAFARSEAYAAQERWAELRSLIQKGNWGRLEFLRYGILSRVEEKEMTPGRPNAARLKWDRAIAATDGDPISLGMLARLASGWGWKRESEQLWWYVARRTTGQRPALKALFKMYFEEKNTVDLYRVCQRLAQMEPENPLPRNNVAMLALLQGKDLPEAHRMAEEIFHGDPSNPAIAATRALSLHLQGRDQEAVEILGQLPQPALRSPSIAACYAVALAARAEVGKAEAYLRIAENNRGELFGEENALIEKTRRTLACALK